MTLLSICIPTRNRQAYAIDAVRHLLRSERDDFEILLADNSDDPVPLADFARTVNDARLRLLPPAPKPLSMRANWERMIPETCGEWIAVIGDDDYLDPELCDVIEVARKAVPKVESIAWGRSYYVWPDARPEGQHITHLPIASNLAVLQQKDLMRRLFFWEGATDRPRCPFGIYHGAVKRQLLERIRDTFSGRYFEHGNVDYDNICKTVMLAEGFVLWERPLSVFGACRASNSYGLNNREAGLERTRTVLAESEGEFEAENFPFPPHLGIAASVGHTIERFKQRYGIELDGWEENFIKACARDVENSVVRAEFNARKEGYAEAISAWRGKKAKKLFQPDYKYRPDVPRFIGTADGKLYFDMDMGETKTAAEFYEMIDAMLFPVHLLESRLA